MKVLNFIVASLGGAVTFFLLGWIAYGMILKDSDLISMDPDMGWKEMPDLAAIFIGEWMIAMLLTLICGYWSRLYTFAGGAKAGAITGLLIALGFGFLMYAQRTDIAMDWMIIDTLISVVRFAIVGGVIAIILKAMAPKEPVAAL